MFLAGIVLFLEPRTLISVYTTDPRVMAVGPTLLLIAAAFQIFDGIQTVSTGALRGLGETRVPMIANLIGYWVIGLPLGFVLCFWMKRGVFGLWIGLTVALIIIAAILLHRWNQDSSGPSSISDAR
jgi:MATE family multidrug resistance protein